MRVPAALLLLAGASSAQILFSLQRVGSPRALLPLPAVTLVRGEPPHTHDDERQCKEHEKPTFDYKKQVEERNAECYKECAKEFATAEGSATDCERGCRLFAIGEAQQPQLPAGEIRDKCAKDCATAYPVLVEQHSCQSGCRHQRPKQQDEDGAPVVMSVMRKYSFESEDGRQVQRSQSSVLVNDGDQMRVIEGPSRVTVSQRGPLPLAGGDSGVPSVLDGMLERMRQTVRHMLLRLNGPELQQEPEQEQEQQEEQRQAVQERLREAQRRLRDRLTQDGQEFIVTAGQQQQESSWHRALRCTPPYVVLGALLLGTALVLYTCYCLMVVARRRRRQQLRQEALVQNEEIPEDLPPKMAEELPPKYVLAVAVEETAKAAEAKEAPPAYTSLPAAAADKLPPKLDV